MNRISPVILMLCPLRRIEQEKVIIIMKVITVLGSPRKTGNTAKVLENIESLLRNTHEVERIDIISHDDRGCL